MSILFVQFTDSDVHESVHPDTIMNATNKMQICRL